MAVGTLSLPHITSYFENLSLSDVKPEKPFHEATVKRTEDHPVKTTASDSQSIKELMDSYAHDKNQSGKKVVVIFGGGPGGLITALAIKRKFGDAYNVMVVEKRPEYSRDNILIFQKDLLDYLASLSNEGDLLKSMLDEGAMTAVENTISSDYKLQKNAYVRFLKNHLLPQQSGISAAIPHLVEKSSRLAGKPNADFSEKYMHMTEEAIVDFPVDKNSISEKYKNSATTNGLDLAWPKGEEIVRVDPAEWQSGDTGKMSSRYVASVETKDFEKALNKYCLEAGIHIVQAEGHLVEKKEYGANQKYVPRLVTKNENGEITGDHIFPCSVDLICLAAGANSKKTENKDTTKDSAGDTGLSGIGEKKTEIEVGERWYHAHYVAEAGLPGVFHLVSKKDEGIRIMCITTSKKNYSVLRVGIGVSDSYAGGKELDDAAVKQLLAEIAQPVLKAWGSNIDVVNDPVNKDTGHDLFTAFRTKNIDVIVRRAEECIDANCVVITDNYASGSPVEGQGASMIGHYAESVARHLGHPDFASTDPTKRESVECEFRNNVTKTANRRHVGTSRILNNFGMYSNTTFRKILAMAMKSIAKSLPATIKS